MIPRFNIKRIKNRLGGTTSITPPPKFQREVLVEQWVARTSTKDAEKYARDPSKLFDENPSLDRTYRAIAKDYDVFVDFPFVLIVSKDSPAFRFREDLKESRIEAFREYGYPVPYKLKASGIDHYVLVTYSKADRDRPSQWHLTDISPGNYLKYSSEAGFGSPLSAEQSLEEIFRNFSRIRTIWDDKMGDEERIFIGGRRGGRVSK